MEAGFAVWVTGGDERTSGRVAAAIADGLVQRRIDVEVLDPRTPGIDALAGPGMERSTAFAASSLVRHGVAVVVAVPSPSRAGRDDARAAIGRMIEVYVPVG
ncbi:MAG: adenylyl-sulfate kinase, partial [Candidatus Binatia bacterium]